MADRNMAPDAMAVLTAVSYLAELDIDTLEAVARAAVRQTYQADQLVFSEGEPCAGLYVVEKGWLKSVKMSLEGREQVVRFVGPGEAFNAVGVLVDAPNPATVIALEPAILWLIGREALAHLLEADQRLARTITQNLARRVLYLMSLVEDLSLRTVESRLARLLLEQVGEGTIQRHRWATQAEMAARVGTVPDVLNRALRKLGDEGLIRVERHQIQILDREALEARAMLEL
jgi:CRP/FNR family transcriptional regulator, dissimilatory nitrate respiration regulator